jgi:capsular exopolysaccharide synthesis family protein
MGTQGVRSILVTSPSPLEGKSLVSINLAITFAQAGKRVLLVDSDLRKPRIHKTFGLSPTVGLSNLLSSEDAVRLGEVVQKTEIENLYVLPSGPRPPNPAELLATEQMRGLLSEMEEMFDRVIFDTPPVVNVTDATILMHFVGGGLVVVRGFTTQRDLAQRASELLQGTQGRMMGVILNNADTPRGAYGYDGYYYYSSQYYYYGDSEEDMRKRGKKRSARAAREDGTASTSSPGKKTWRPWSKKKSEIRKEETTPNDHPDLPV